MPTPAKNLTAVEVPLEDPTPVVEQVVETPPAPPRPRGIRRIETSFYVGHDFYPRGTTVRVGHPLIEQFPQFFYPAGSVDVELEPEQE
jgi:hypothetical protein